MPFCLCRPLPLSPSLTPMAAAEAFSAATIGVFGLLRARRTPRLIDTTLQPTPPLGPILTVETLPCGRSLFYSSISAAISLWWGGEPSLRWPGDASFKMKLKRRRVLEVASPRNVSRLVSVRAEVITEAPAKVEKVSKKNEEGVIVNKFKPKNPYTGRCLLNTKITRDDAPGETWHMVFSTEGEIPYREGQSIGVIADGIDKNGSGVMIS